MRTFLFNKLVRDHIPAHMRAQGERPEVRILNFDEYHQELAKKLGEEALELSAARGTEIISELADIHDILVCLVEINGFTREDVEIESIRKLRAVGSFKKRQFIGSVAVPDSNQWIQHLESNPERYPEVT